MRRTIAFLFVALCAGGAAALDYAAACGRPARGARARPAPCDLARLGYCAAPGLHYPWHAIRRFVRENQGLMKRMYGEERHISIIKAELENFVEDDEDPADRDEHLTEDIIRAKLKYSKMNQARAMNRPHFRPIQSTPPTFTKRHKHNNDTLKVKPLSARNETLANVTASTNNTFPDDKGISYKTKLESIANVEIDHLDVITLEAVIKQSIETNSIYSNAPETNKSDVKDSRNDTEKLETTTDANSSEVTTEEEQATTEPVKDAADASAKRPQQPPATLPPTLLFSEHDKPKDRPDPTDKKEEFHLKPGHHQEPPRPAVIKLRGANACESKEEMAAPFWANNTRGEVLALLNMYPFEQYIHLETCVHEKKQMYCREGCRCEQQYRLHRLLAYDPRNECRGIFADWFKFPACCVCRCYDVPLELRARSPRILPPQYGDQVRRALYEDVARDWYDAAWDFDSDV